ncbi:TPA: cytochrome o ubiquinol oxidase subunit IV [Candidatus Saccharibacteria bacterium]|nr:cytochrome o ubiquinol oxidase subunit IV [Candidatus Saccharibacteria bacterium]HRK40867.1 cytochrome o ubiquinol oxidase subunit IV [Candidatus Saccharibacteria bacterium]
MTDSKKLMRSYLIGFVLSLGLTLIAFVLTTIQSDFQGKAYPDLPLAVALVTLAITQLIVQLLFFFHLGHEAKPRLNLASFLFMLMVVGIVAFGSLWIMYHLNYNMMPHEVETYIQQEENIDLDSSNDHEHHH